jgi:hypothetical protein
LVTKSENNVQQNEPILQSCFSSDPKRDGNYSVTLSYCDLLQDAQQDEPIIKNEISQDPDLEDYDNVSYAELGLKQDAHQHNESDNSSEEIIFKIKEAMND